MKKDFKKNKLPSIEIVEHPSELLDLDEETIAIAKAKFAGVDLDSIYGDEDRTSSELRLKIQSKKIRELFQDSEEVRVAFSSEQKKKQAFKDMKIDGIDLEFIKEYCQKKQLEFDNDAEALIRVGFERDDSGELNV